MFPLETSFPAPWRHFFCCISVLFSLYFRCISVVFLLYFCCMLYFCCISVLFLLYFCCISVVFLLYFCCICAVFVLYLCCISSVVRPVDEDAGNPFPVSSLNYSEAKLMSPKDYQSPRQTFYKGSTLLQIT